MKNMRLTVCIGIMCGWLAAGMLHAGTRPDHVRPVEEDGSRLWLPVIRPVEGAEVEITYKGKVSPTIAIAIAELKNAWKGDPVLLEKKKTASFTLTPKLWIEKTKATGIASKQGKGGGTFAHPMIGCEFASWISPEFKMLLLKLSLGREQVR